MCSIFTFLNVKLKAQNGFSFLNLSSQAKIIGIGGNVCTMGKNTNLSFIENPAFLVAANTKKINLSQSVLFGKGNFSSIDFQSQSKQTQIGFFAQLLNFGTFDGYTSNGISTGTFNANDICLGMSLATKKRNINYGISLKLANSNVEIYNSNAILFDFGAVFIHPKNDFSFGLSIRNLGLVLKEYLPNQANSLPLDIRIGSTFKLKHAPFRFTISMVQLNDLIKKPTTSNAISVKNSAGVTQILTQTPFKKIANHVNLGTEILISPNVSILFGYKFRNQDLAIPNQNLGNGLSFGANFGGRFLNLGYAYQSFSVAGGQHSLSINLDSSKLLK